VTGFQCLNQRILITNDDYIRTTSDRHKKTAQELWKKCHANGDIYLDTYNGWYNIREEAFVTDSEAALSDFKDPTSGLPLKQVKEESYFFKMSAYHDKLVKYIQDNPDFIRPEQHRNGILARLTADPLRDLSISRTTFKWGIHAPEGFDPNHVMYVWVDALSNYLTGVNGLNVDTDAKEGLSKFWPASVHIIGKDILWFHTVIWPCLLMSAGLPLPKTVFAHGFVNDKEGKKMSKSMGNVVDPHDMLDKFDVDTFRWYLCKEAPYGGELAFSENSLRDMHNADLCDTLGNLVHRATNLCQKFCGGVVPDVPAPSNPPINMDVICTQYIAKMNNFELQGGANVAIQGFRDVNKYLADEAPWLKKGDEHAELRQVVVRACLEAVYALTHLMTPYIPIGASRIFEKLGKEPVGLVALGRDCRNLEVGAKIQIGDVLYSKVCVSCVSAEECILEWRVRMILMP
jgi:methionyl-tRNA synthetase